MYENHFLKLNHFHLLFIHLLRLFDPTLPIELRSPRHYILLHSSLTFLLYFFAQRVRLAYSFSKWEYFLALKRAVCRRANEVMMI